MGANHGASVLRERESEYRLDKAPSRPWVCLPRSVQGEERRRRRLVGPASVVEVAAATASPPANPARRRRDPDRVACDPQIWAHGATRSNEYS